MTTVTDLETVKILNVESMTTDSTFDREKLEQQNEFDLREIAHWYGGWDELRKVIDRLEDNDNEVAYERHTSDYDAVSINELCQRYSKVK